MDDQTVTQPISNSPQPRHFSISWQSIMLIVGTIALTIALAFVPRNFIEQLGNYGYIGVFLLTLLSSATIVLPSPALGVAYAAGAVLNPWIVGILCGVAAGLGEITGYLAGKGGNELAKQARFYPQIASYVERWGMVTIFVLAIIPSPIFDFAGIAAGSMNMPFWKYFIACTLGKTIRFIAIAWLPHFI